MGALSSDNPALNVFETPNMGVTYINPYRFGVGAAFSPLDLPGLLLWLDASDASTITESAGLVSQWNDKSGNANHVTATLAERPTTGTRTVGGLNGIDFNGSSNLMKRLDSLGLTGSPALYIALVLRIDVNNPADRPFGIGESTGVGGQVILVATDGSFRFNNGAQVFANPSITKDIQFLATREAGDQHGDGLMWFDNISQTESSTTNPTNTSNITDELTTIGTGVRSGGSTTDYYDGVIAEVIIGNATLSASDRNALWGYSEPKWSL
jgi:hypothetical protein